MIKIITDSASDISQEEAKQLGITVLPLTSHFGDVEYRDGIDITTKEFFEKLIESDVFPTTSCISPAQCYDAFKEHKEDDIIFIGVSSKLSGCCQSAVIASEDFNNVHIIDSETVTVGQRLLIELALKLVNEGKTVDEIVDILETKKKDIRLVALLDTLEYLRKGGRVSGAAAVIGGLLSIKPVIALEDGLIAVLGKARGSKSGSNFLNEKIKEYGSIDFSLPYCVAYSGLSDHLLQKYIKDNKNLYLDPSDELRIFTIGSVIGTHAGPGAIVAAFFANKE